MNDQQQLTIELPIKQKDWHVTYTDIITDKSFKGARLRVLIAEEPWYPQDSDYVLFKEFTKRFKIDTELECTQYQYSLKGLKNRKFQFDKQGNWIK